MPRFDRTGPQGMGPMTGRGRGHCAGFVPGAGWRRPFYRMGMAFRHGWRQRYYPDWDPEFDIEPADEKEWLLREQNQLKQQLEAIQERISKLENKVE